MISLCGSTVHPRAYVDIAHRPLLDQIRRLADGDIKLPCAML